MIFLAMHDWDAYFVWVNTTFGDIRVTLSQEDAPSHRYQFETRLNTLKSVGEYIRHHYHVLYQNYDQYVIKQSERFDE